MDKEQFIATLNYYGEENLIGISFDNSASMTFREDGAFSLERNYIESINSLQFVAFDAHGIPFIVVKSLSDIQGMMFKDMTTRNRSDYDFITIRG